jgi:hypothetical protein
VDLVAAGVFVIVTVGVSEIVALVEGVIDGDVVTVTVYDGDTDGVGVTSWHVGDCDKASLDVVIGMCAFALMSNSVTVARDP